VFLIFVVLNNHSWVIRPMNSNPKWIRLTLDMPKVIRFTKWIWTQIHCESWSESDNRIAPKRSHLLQSSKFIIHRWRQKEHLANTSHRWVRARWLNFVYFVLFVSYCTVFDVCCYLSDYNDSRVSLRPIINNHVSGPDRVLGWVCVCVCVPMCSSSRYQRK